VKKNKKIKQIGIRISNELNDKLIKASAICNRYPSEFVRDAIVEKIERISNENTK